MFEFRSANQASRGKHTALGDSESIHKNPFYSYKLCHVEFRYWGIQKRMENFILDYALRRTMLKVSQLAIFILGLILQCLLYFNLPLKGVWSDLISFFQAHQQAWAWQDEWHDLTIEDIRRLEEKTQRELFEKYHQDKDLWLNFQT